MKNYFKYIAILALGIVSCEPELDNPIDEAGFYTNGEADFTNYVALGNSLTAGYADGALYITGQKNSYPNILASKFALTQETNGFYQPLVNDNYGGLLAGGQVIPGFDTRYVLSVIEGDTLPKRFRGNAPTTDVLNRLQGAFNNMGVPGAKSYHLLANGYGSVAGLQTNPPSSNPYFVRFASSDNTSVIADALAQDPTFFTLWIGNNDVLSYATSGGVGEYRSDGNFASYGENDITNSAAFAGVYKALIQQLTGNGAEGVLINIPNVNSLPYFKVVPYAPLSPLDPNFGPQIPTLNSTFAPLNQAYAFLQSTERNIVFSPTAASAVLIRDESLPNISQQLTQVLIGGGVDPATAGLYGMQYGQSRQANADDLLLLTSSSVIGKVNQVRMQELIGFGLDQATAAKLSVNGVTYPLQDQYVLTPDEQLLVKNATIAYNIAISQIAETNTLGYVDANSLLEDRIGIDGGTVYQGVPISSAFVSGGAFSLDGVHLTPRGYAVIANEIINEINTTYNATVPAVEVGNYGTVTLNNDVQ